jgi:hypothetical protein
LCRLRRIDAGFPEQAAGCCEYRLDEAAGCNSVDTRRQDHGKAAEDALSLDCVRTIGGTLRWLPPLVEDRHGDYWPSFERRKKILHQHSHLGSGADLVIWAVNRFMPQLPEGLEIVNLVHDEVDAIVTRETLKATVDVITRAFQETFAGFYPSSDLVPKIKFSCGPKLGRNRSDR